MEQVASVVVADLVVAVQAVEAELLRQDEILDDNYNPNELKQEIINDNYSTMSLTQELAKKSSSRKKILWSVAGIVLVGAAYGAYAYFSSVNTAPVVVAPTPYTIKKGDITLGLDEQ